MRGPSGASPRVRRKPAAAPPVRIIDIVTVVSIMVAGVVLVGKALEERVGTRSFPTPVETGVISEPIAAEANVFGVMETELGVAPSFHGHEGAHVRTLEMYQALRAYPGAPPRVPHGLTDDEYRDSSCSICHQRGGWVARFGTYAPVTPHPEHSACLQCHVPQDILVGRDLPVVGDSIACQQCHIDPDKPLETYVELDWETVAWPESDVKAMPESPNRIPHDFRTRTNCLACHSGPGSVIDLRTDHPERLNCRQCHVQISEGVEPFPGASVESDRSSEGGA